MTLVPSLLQAIVIMDGEALVLHVGDRPYVVTDDGQVTISNTPLTHAAVDDVLAELLTPESRRVFDELGATQWDLPAVPDVPFERFSAVAARGADDVWVEIRRTSGVNSEALGFAGRDASGARTPDSIVANTAPTAPMSARADGASDRRRDAGPDVQSRPIVETPSPAAPEPVPAVIVPLTQPSIRALASVTHPNTASLDQVLQLAASRGASTLYLVSGATPVVRIDADLRGLDGVGPLSALEIESGLLALASPADADAALASREWTVERPDIGRVRCRTFVDARGPGGIIRFSPRRPLTLQQLGLPRELGALASARDGLLLVAGPRGSGRRTLLASLVDQINRVRHAHIVTVEREIAVVHERITGLVTQIEVRSPDATAAAVRQALADDPDVLVVESVHAPEVLDLVMEAVADGRLVLCGVVAPDVTTALESWLELAPAASRARLQATLARHLRAAIGQVLVRTAGGGRVAARELVLKSPAVSAVLGAGRVNGLSVAVEAGRRQGMVTLHDALVALVQAGAVDAPAACEASPAADQLRIELQRLGIDVSAVERRA